MTAITAVVLLFLTFYNAVQASYYSKCEIVGLKDDDWGTYTLKMPINDTFRGEIMSYTTRNIFRMKISSSKYMSATWEDQTLRLFTADNFDTYEQDSSYTTNPVISISLKFDCTEDGEDSMTFKQPVLDANNHLPVLNEKRYNYNFGMTIPKGLKLTEILPIVATDRDLTNDRVTFTLDEENENFSLDRDGKQNFKQYTTQLTTLNEIVAPFSQKFTLTATDNGFPESTSTAVLTINVYTQEEAKAAEAEEKAVHPPVFAKHLYFADYSLNHQLKMEESISIKYGAQSDTIAKQTGYEEYFTVGFQGSNRDMVVVQKKSSLPKEILDSTDFITIEIEAINQGFEHMPGRTAVLIRLPRMNSGASEGGVNGSSTNCKDVVVFGYSVHTYVVPLVLFLLAVFSLVFINIYVIIMFVNKHKVRAGGV